MAGRLPLWSVGVVAALLYLSVGYFALFTLGPALGCTWAPEFRFWGYGPESFTRCFAPVPAQIIADYRDVLLGQDRLLAVALTGFLALWSLRHRTWIGFGAAMAYGLSDWFENGFMVAALGGEVSATTTASLLTMSKFAWLILSFGACLWAVRRARRVP
jgi:hypothetical protein